MANGEALIDRGPEPPDAFASLVRAEHSKLGEAIRAFGIRSGPRSK
jgi:hypothetical protein